MKDDAKSFAWLLLLLYSVVITTSGVGKLVYSFLRGEVTETEKSHKLQTDKMPVSKHTEQILNLYGIIACGVVWEYVPQD